MGGDNLYAYAPNLMGWIDPLGLAPWKNGKFKEWFNQASPEDILKNKSSVSNALRGCGGKHEMFPVSMASKAKELGFTAEDIMKMSVDTSRITFVNVTKSNGVSVDAGAHTGTSAGRPFILI